MVSGWFQGGSMVVLCRRWWFKADSHGKMVLSRCLHTAERFSVQGFRPDEVDGLRYSGNAYSVLVVTHVFHQLLGVSYFRMLQVSLTFRRRFIVFGNRVTSQRCSFMLGF